MKEKQEIGKSIQEQILDKMFQKLEENEFFENSFLKELKEVDLTKPSAVKDIINKEFKKDEDSKAGDKTS